MYFFLFLCKVLIFLDQIQKMLKKEVRLDYLLIKNITELFTYCEDIEHFSLALFITHFQKPGQHSVICSTIFFPSLSLFTRLPFTFIILHYNPKRNCKISALIYDCENEKNVPQLPNSTIPHV